MKRSPALTFLIFAAASVGTLSVLNFLISLLDLYYLSGAVAIISFILLPVVFIIALSKVYNSESEVHGAGHAFVGALIFVGVQAVLGLVFTLAKGNLHLMFWFWAMLPGYLLNFGILLIAMSIFSRWRLFQKAGKPGWASIVPIYNLVVQCEIAQAPGWWVAMILLVPIANIVFAIMLLNRVVYAYGKESGFTVGMIFLSFIFMPILALGDNKYLYGESGQQTVGPNPA